MEFEMRWTLNKRQDDMIMQDLTGFCIDLKNDLGKYHPINNPPQQPTSLDVVKENIK